MERTMLKHKKVLSKDSSTDIAGRIEPLGSVHRDRGIHELYPGHVQEVDTTQIHQLNAVQAPELDNAERRSTTPKGKKTPSARSLKPLPRLPVELSGHPVRSSLERGNVGWELDFLRYYQRATTNSARGSPTPSSVRR